MGKRQAPLVLIVDDFEDNREMYAQYLRFHGYEIAEADNGQEALKQLALFGEGPADYLFACAGGGSNLAGISFPFIRENLEGRSATKIVACEPKAQ